MFQIKFTPTTSPAGKLADAEIHFTHTVADAEKLDGELDVTADALLSGLKLAGFAIWERRSGGGRNVTFPARAYSINGERRSFALLRPTLDPNGQERVRQAILDAFAEYERLSEQLEQMPNAEG